MDAMSGQEKDNPGTAAPDDPVIRGRCLVLAPREGAVSGALLSALGKRGLSVHLVGDEPGVMVELASGGCAVVVAVNPPVWPRLSELAYAVRQHYPRVLCWQFTEDESGVPRLKALDTDFLGPKPPSDPGPGQHGLAAAKWSGTLPAQAQADLRPSDTMNGGVVGPIGRIRGRRRLIDDLVIQAPHGPAPTNALVTQEELTMLLGPTPGEAS